MLADNMNAKIPTLFRTYRAPTNQTADCRIWEAARATTATPKLFKPISIANSGVALRYIDARHGGNNPVSQVLEEAEALFPNRPISCVISIGSGHPSTIHIPNLGFLQRVGLLSDDILRTVSAMASDCEEKHQETARRFANSPGLYFRLNVREGMQDVGSEEWKKYHYVASHTQQYMKMQETKHTIDYAVRALRGVQHAPVGIESSKELLFLLASSEN